MNLSESQNQNLGHGRGRKTCELNLSQSRAARSFHFVTIYTKTSPRCLIGTTVLANFRLGKFAHYFCHDYKDRRGHADLAYLNHFDWLT